MALCRRSACLSLTALTDATGKIEMAVVIDPFTIVEDICKDSDFILDRVPMQASKVTAFAVRVVIPRLEFPRIVGIVEVWLFRLGLLPTARGGSEETSSVRDCLPCGTQTLRFRREPRKGGVTVGWKRHLPQHVI